jgi:hypothetical protein
MFSQFVGGESAARIFTYEVTGLRQNDETENNSYALRNSSSVFINVPYGRMNPEMQRITRLGGTIVSIKPYDGSSALAY